MHHIIPVLWGSGDPTWPQLMLHLRQHYSPNNMKTNLFWTVSEIRTHNNLLTMLINIFI